MKFIYEKEDGKRRHTKMTKVDDKWKMKMEWNEGWNEMSFGGVSYAICRT